MSLWCLMSHTILTAHSALHTPIEMTGATNDYKIEKNNDAFVDDMDGWAEAPNKGSSMEEIVLKSLQWKAQYFANLIAILGGAIKFHKLIWQVIR